MKAISLQGRSFKTTRQTVDSLAWATNRRGRITWEDPENVITKIIKYLEDHNVALFTAQGRGATAKHFRETMDRLVKEGYAEVKAGGAHNALTMFRFLDDVDLNGHHPEFNKLGGEVVDQSPKAGLTFVPDADQVPLPPLPPPPRYKAHEVNVLLDEWAGKDPDGYADWADKLMERLGVIFNG